MSGEALNCTFHCCHDGEIKIDNLNGANLVTKSWVCSLLTTTGRSGKLGVITYGNTNRYLCGLMLVWSLYLGSCLWAQEAVCPRSGRENEFIVTQDPRGAGAGERVLYFDGFVDSKKVLFKVLKEHLYFLATYTYVRQTGCCKTKQPKDAGKSQATLSVGVLA